MRPHPASKLIVILPLILVGLALSFWNSNDAMETESNSKIQLVGYVAQEPVLAGPAIQDPDLENQFPAQASAAPVRVAALPANPIAAAPIAPAGYPTTGWAGFGNISPTEPANTSNTKGFSVSQPIENRQLPTIQSPTSNKGFRVDVPGEPVTKQVPHVAQLPGEVTGQTKINQSPQPKFQSTAAPHAFQPRAIQPVPIQPQAKKSQTTKAQTIEPQAAKPRQPVAGPSASDRKVHYNSLRAPAQPPTNTPRVATATPPWSYPITEQAPVAVAPNTPTPAEKTPATSSPSVGPIARTAQSQTRFAPPVPGTTANWGDNQFVPNSAAVSNPHPVQGPLQPSGSIASSQDFGGTFNLASGTSTSANIWWKDLVVQPLNPNNATNMTDTNRLLYEALRNSPRIQAISKDPLIREMQITEADSEFDPIGFVQSLYDDRVDPVGNTLTTGGAPFLKDNIFNLNAGVRKKTRTGGQVELSQTIGFQNSNSRFFEPQDQGTATIALNYSQPLLRGSGRYFNASQILIAQSANGVAWQAFQSELQDELQTVTESYWQLFFARSSFLQKQRNVERGEKILNLLEGRRDLDSLPSQIARAKASVLSRKTELANAFRDVRNAETEVRRLIADPNWLSNQEIELIPTEAPTAVTLDIPLQQVVRTALDNRSEIRESVQRAKIAAIQRDVSHNELLPELSLLFGTYLSALEGDTGIARAWQRQFNFGQTTPGVSLGFEFEMPYRNRAARSRLAQSRLQLAKIKHEVDEAAQNVISESQIALRRLESARQTLDASVESINAARVDLEQNQLRWESFALVEGDLADGQTPTTVLDQLLDSQDRLAGAELVYAQTELENKVAEIALRRSMGTLLQSAQVGFTRSLDHDTPSLHLHRADGTSDGQPITQIHGATYSLDTEPQFMNHSAPQFQNQTPGQFAPEDQVNFHNQSSQHTPTNAPIALPANTHLPSGSASYDLSAPAPGRYPQPSRAAQLPEFHQGQPGFHPQHPNQFQSPGQFSPLQNQPNPRLPVERFEYPPSSGGVDRSASLPAPRSAALDRSEPVIEPTPSTSIQNGEFKDIETMFQKPMSGFVSNQSPVGSTEPRSSDQNAGSISR